jgi:hypothetical protein
MTEEDKNSFENWFKTLNRDVFLPHKEMMKVAWEEAIKHEQNKPVRTYRWDGVLR